MQVRSTANTPRSCIQPITVHWAFKYRYRGEPLSELASSQRSPQCGWHATHVWRSALRRHFASLARPGRCWLKEIYRDQPLEQSGFNQFSDLAVLRHLSRQLPSAFDLVALIWVASTW